MIDFTELNACMTLTQRDYDEIGTLVRKTVKEEVGHLPSKDEFYGKMDEVMGELKAIREGQEIVTAKVYEDHEPRISKIEKKLRIPASS